MDNRDSDNQGPNVHGLYKVAHVTSSTSRYIICYVKETSVVALTLVNQIYLFLWGFALHVI